MNNFKFPIVAALATSTLSISTPHISFAQEVNDVIIVTANRRPQPLSQVGSSVSVVSAEDIERNQQIFVLDALETLPGVSISQNGPFGGTASVSLRGVGGNNTVMLVDGVQLNDASSPGGAYNFGTLDTYNIERIEVLRGPQSVLYGSDAIGGVVNVITKTGGEGLGGKIFAEGGSFNTFRAAGNIFGGNDKLGFNLSASGTSTDGISAADENDGNTEKDGLSSINLSGKVTSRVSESVKVEFISNYSDNSGDFDSFGPVDGDNVADTNEFIAVGRIYADALDGRLSNTLSAEYTQIDRKSFTDGVETSDATGKRTNFDYLGVFTVDDAWTLTGGAQHEATKSRVSSDESFTINSLFGETAFTGIKNLVVTGGVRYDDHETFGSETTFRTTASYQIEQTGTKLIANWGQGFKAPSVFQLTYICTFCGLTEPSSGLKPERATGYEFGFEQALADDKVTFGATYFHQKSKDLIDFDFSAGYVNVNSARSKGVEITLNAELLENLMINANYTYTNAVNLDTNLTLAREPKHLISGSVQWMPIARLSTVLNVTHNGSEEQSFGAGTLDRWTRVDIRVSYELYEDLSVYARIDNLLDEEYQHVLGYGTPDRSFFGGIRKTF